MTFVLIVIALIVVGVPVHARLFPMKPCPACKGARKRFGGGGTFGYCGRCKKTGEVRRWLAGKENR